MIPICVGKTTADGANVCSNSCHRSIVCCLALIDFCTMDSELHSSDHSYQDIVAKPILPNLMQHNLTLCTHVCWFAFSSNIGRYCYGIYYNSYYHGYLRSTT